MSEPTIIAGPAFIKRGTHIVYTEDMIAAREIVETWNTKSAMFPSGGERVKSRIWEITCTPCGEVRDATDLARYWPYAPTDIGTNIFTDTAVALAIIPKTGNKHTFARSALTQMPSMSLGPTSKVWGPMKWTCLGDPTIAATAAGYYEVIAAKAGGDADTSFDASKIISPRFTIAYGSSPFNAMEPADIIKVEPKMAVSFFGGVNYGIQTGYLTDLGVVAEFTPYGLTEADLQTLLAYQGASAKLPGDLIAAATDLVFTGTGLVLTLKNMGPGAGGWKFSSGDFRQDAVQFHNKLTSTTGVANALWTLAVA